MITEITTQLRQQRLLLEVLERDMVCSIEEMATLLINTFAHGGKLLIMGNGGSAADAQHFAAEIVGRFKMERKALPAISLSANTSILTAVGNDYGFETVFSRQIEALANDGDAVIGISTSGNSPNILRALEVARKRNCKLIALTGKDGGMIKNLCDLSLVIPSSETPRIQECHIIIIHVVCDLLEKALFSR